jgi:MFS family permease
VLAFSAVPSPLYPDYQARDGFSSFMITVVFASYALGVVFSLFAIGHLSDWHGRRRVIVPALLTSMLSAVVFLLWRDLPGLIVARVISGVAVGAMTATATAWLPELHAARHPDASPRRAQVVSTAANLGGIGIGPLVAGALAQWVGSPLTIPYLVSLAALVVALLAVLASPETRERLRPLPRYRPQRVAVPAGALGRYLAAALSGAISFAALGLFTSLAPSFLAGTLGDSSAALAGATIFAVFGASAVAQMLIAARSTREALAGGTLTMLAGLAVLVIAVWLPSPSLALFLVGGVVAGAGAGCLFKGAISTVVAISVPERRAEALAGLFLASYLGLSLPVVGLGVLTQSLTPRSSLLIFAAVLAAGALAATPLSVGRAEPAGAGA